VNWHGPNSAGSGPAACGDGSETGWSYGLDHYHWNGSAFVWVERLVPPTYGSGQGIAISGDTFYWADRPENSIVVTTYTTGTTYTIGGTVAGLTGTGLILLDNGDNNLSVSGDGSFVFTSPITNGNTYSVTVGTQPSGETCSVTNGSGTASANVTNVQVACSIG
jgi:hypothetical protein